MKKRVLILATLAIFTSCGFGKKTHLSSLEFSNNQKYVYQDGEAFTGEAWSSDEKTVCIHAESGVITSFIVFHDNGKVAANISSNGFKKSRTCYDKNGNVITWDQLKEMYPILWHKARVVKNEMNEIDK